MSYCLSVQALPENHVSRFYHDHVYGIPVEDDRLLFERLVMEINQAGLSWETILKNRKILKRLLIFMISKKLLIMEKMRLNVFCKIQVSLETA